MGYWMVQSTTLFSYMSMQHVHVNDTMFFELAFYELDASVATRLSNDFGNTV